MTVGSRFLSLFRPLSARSDDLVDLLLEVLRSWSGLLAVTVQSAFDEVGEVLVFAERDKL